jgi:hypothetical protein
VSASRHGQAVQARVWPSSQGLIIKLLHLLQTVQVLQTTVPARQCRTAAPPATVPDRLLILFHSMSGMQPDLVRSGLSLFFP